MVEGPILTSARTFQVWRYNVGHKTLLIRSGKDVEHPTRIDLVIVNVIAMKLLTSFHGFTIREASSTEALAAIREAEMEDPGELNELRDSRVFLVGEAGHVGWVIGADLGVHEDVGDWNDPSHFDVTHFPNPQSPVDPTRRERWLEQRNRRWEEPGYEAAWAWSQCGGCRHWVALTGVPGYDFGACTNAASPFDGRVRFEHDGCEAFESKSDGAAQARIQMLEWLSTQAGNVVDKGS